MQLQSEVKEIFADLREHLLYMQELGVERLAIELPEQEFAVDDADVPPFEVTPRVVEERLSEPVIERYVPPELPKVERPVESPSTPRTLGGSRISALPSLSSRKPMPRKATKTANEEVTPTTPKKDNEEPATPLNIAAAEPAGSMFGEMAELPESNETIEQIRADIGNCTRCPLYAGRTQIVHSTGNLQAELMFVGEAPGADEDAKGFPFVGRAGQLLTKIIESIGFKREEVFIGNINRCRPPANRTPTLQEAHTCRPFLQREIAVVRPKVIVVLGNTALHNLLDTKIGITKLRGEFQDYMGVKVMPTFHPAFLLRDPRKKREVWEDMKKVRDYLKSE